MSSERVKRLLSLPVILDSRLLAAPKTFQPSCTSSFQLHATQLTSGVSLGLFSAMQFIIYFRNVRSRSSRLTTMGVGEGVSPSILVKPEHEIPNARARAKKPPWRYSQIDTSSSLLRKGKPVDWCKAGCGSRLNLIQYL